MEVGPRGSAGEVVQMKTAKSAIRNRELHQIREPTHRGAHVAGVLHPTGHGVACLNSALDADGGDRVGSFFP